MQSIDSMKWKSSDSNFLIYSSEHFSERVINCISSILALSQFSIKFTITDYSLIARQRNRMDDTI